MADGESRLNVATIREGLVFSNKYKLPDNIGLYGKISFKSISNKYLLKYDL